MVHIPNLTARGTVPWQFDSSSENYLQYVWRSPRTGDPSSEFEASIICESGRWTWEVVADPEGSPLRIAAGSGANREYCEEMVLEAVGKAFAVPSIHRGLATAASKRYTIASGTRIDLAPGEGRAAVATLVDKSTWSGTLHVGGWFIELEEEDGSIVRLSPQQVASIRPA